MIELGAHYMTLQKGEPIEVVPEDIVRDVNNKHYGKWVCRKIGGRRTLKRSERQLHPMGWKPLRPVGERKFRVVE